MYYANCCCCFWTFPRGRTFCSRRWVVTGRMVYFILVVVRFSKPLLVVHFRSSYELVALFKITTVQRDLLATVANQTVSATIHKFQVWLITIRKRPRIYAFKIYARVCSDKCAHFPDFDGVSAFSTAVLLHGLPILFGPLVLRHMTLVHGLSFTAVLRCPPYRSTKD